MLCKLNSFLLPKQIAASIRTCYKHNANEKHLFSGILFIAFFFSIYCYCLCVFPFYRLHDSETKAFVTRYEVSRIIFYFRGRPDSADQACFAFTFQTGETNDLNPLFQCYIFRCNIPEAVTQVSSK